MNETSGTQVLPLSKLAVALLAAQREIEGVSKDATNPHFKSKFADLTSVIEAVVPILNKHGITVVQLPTPGPEGHLSLTTLLLHESGESISGTAQVPLSKQDPQAYGSAMTYARRYSLGAAVSLKFIDDDAEAAVGRNNGSVSEQPKEKPPAPPKGLNFGGGASKRPEKKTAAPVRGKTGLFPKVATGDDNAPE